MTSIIVCAAVMCSSVSAEEKDDAKVKASFDSLAKLLIGGTWNRDDDPSFKHTYRWGIEGKFIHRVGIGGPLSDVGMIGIDPETSEINFWLFNEDGTVGTLLCKQESEGVWTFSSDVKGPDGDHRFRGRATRVDNDTLKEEILENIVNGKPEKKGEFTWRRTREKS
jgi:hypothetical protein